MYTLKTTASFNQGSGGTSNYEDLENKPKINNVELEGNKSLSDLGIQAEGDYATNDRVDEVENEIPDVSSFINKDANNLTNYTLKTDTGSTIELSIDPTTYVMTFNLVNENGDVISTQNVDLPLETMVVSATYDSETKEIVLTLQSGVTTRFSVADLVSGLVSISDLEETLENYQPLLTAGDNITIDENNVISASGEEGNKAYYYFMDSSKGAISYWQDKEEESLELFNQILEDIDNGQHPIVSVIYGNSSLYAGESQVDRSFSSNWVCSVFKTSSLSGRGRVLCLKGNFSPYSSKAGVPYSFRLVLEAQIDATTNKITGIYYGSGADEVYLAYLYGSYNQSGGTNNVLSTKNEKSFVPTAGSYNPATALYAEQQAEKVKVQYATMPEASADNLGKIVQYTGETDTYTQGHFYIVTTDGGEEPTYSWQEISFGGGDNNFPIYEIEADTTLVNISISNSDYNKSVLNKVYSDLINGKKPLVLVGMLDSSSNYQTKSLCTVTKLGFSNWLMRIEGSFVKWSDSGAKALYHIIDLTIYGNRTTGEISSIENNSHSNFLVGNYARDNDASISKALTVDNTSAFTPTNDYHPATKKYIDDLIAEAGGGGIIELTENINASELDYGIYFVNSDSNIRIVGSTDGNYREIESYSAFYVTTAKNNSNNYIKTVISLTGKLGNSISGLFVGTSSGKLHVYIINNENNIYTALDSLEIGAVLPFNNTAQFTVSSDYNLVHKKYVDDKPITYTGYDATKTQTLKNINGTLTWVDD